ANARAERVLTLRELNRALLERQLLLARRRLSVPGALERLCALQAQYSPSPYIALWSRLTGFRKEQLTGALEDRTAVKSTLVRIGDATGSAPVRGGARRRPACRHRRPRAAAVSRRAGTRAARPAARSAARRGGSGTRPLPAEVGLVAPRVCTARAGAHPAGEV